ncbi:MAG: twin-arginine translocase subunit TatC [Fibrobacter sp.]|nr:twin-arginine translocase subunit TatC [Fibrobacter sp.]
MIDGQPQESSLAFHLEALRLTLIRCLVALGIGIIPMFLLSPYALNWFTSQMEFQTGSTLHYFAPMEVFLLQFKMAALFDCILCSPFIAWNLWKFILPALYNNEKKFVRTIAFLTSFLFIAGVAFCLTVCFPLIVRFGLSFQNDSLQPVIGVSSVISLALWLSLAFGSMFQFPLVTYAIIRAGIVRYETVCHCRPYVLIAILVFAALLTPPDILSQLILGIPTYLLFEAGLLAARRFKTKTSETIYDKDHKDGLY